ncbi:MAG: endolytic transglycosylase MltG [Ruminococcus sp.]|nr:endolytic transglycosylase MltG [Ruminococcus sp.]
MKNKVIIFIAIIGVFLGAAFGLYFAGLKPVSNSNTTIEFNVSAGANKLDIVNDLKNKGLIKSKLASTIYILYNDISLQAGLYELKPNMDAKEIIAKLNTGDIKKIENTFSLTFIEGKRITDYAKVIAEATNSTPDEVMEFLNDREYLEELINKYWFLTEDILKDGIYYPLEGYLFPSTYNLYNGSSIKDIITRLLDGMETKLKDIKDDIENSKYTVHEIITLASIVESEGANADDRAGVAGVFYNRLNNNEALGSDVTAYYAAKKDFSTDLYLDEINACNPYNTRGTCAIVGVPVGPISNPSFESIKATISPKDHDYYFFVADKNKKTYFSKTYSEHIAKTDELKRNGLWYVYE